MPLTLQEFRQLSPEQLRAQYSPQELEDFRARVLQPTQPAVPGDNGITPYNPNADFFSGDNMGRMASNVPGSAWNVAKDTYNAVTSPIETAEAVIEAGPSVILAALGERFGSVEALKRTAVEDPFGLALDAAPGMGAVGAAAKAGKLGGTAGRVAQAASRINPATALVKGTTAAASKVGQAAAAGARELTGITTGIDPGVISTARQSLTGSEAQRRAFQQSARGTSAPTAIPDGVQEVVGGLRTERNQIFKQAEAQLSSRNLRATPERLQSFRNKVAQDLHDEFDIDLSRESLDGSGLLDFEDVGGLREAPAAVRSQINRAFSRIQTSDGSLADLWKARQDIDRIAERAQAARATKVEAAIFTKMRDNVTDLLNELGGPEFRQLNQQYAEASRLIDDFSDISNAKGKTQQQINSVVRSIREQSRFSEDILERVESKTGVPLRALAAGTEFSEGVARGLIGRSKFAEVAFAGAAAITSNPMLLTGLLFTSPKLVGRTMEFLGAGERVIRQADGVVQKIMSMPGATELAEQGLTVGAIVQQLEREQPNLLGAIGATRR